MNVAQEIGRRARHRLERHGAFVRAAKRVVFAEGLGALTMQRLADEVDSAVGTVYTYFPSKSALVAELQREAIEVLDASCARFEATFAAHVGGAAPAVRQLALVTGLVRFWVDTFETHPEEARLLRMLMSSTPAASVVVDEDVSRVLPAALRLLSRMKAALDGAAEVGAIAAGDGMERTVVLVAALNGVLLIETVARVDPLLFDGRRLARSLVADLLRGWGADGRSLAAAAHRIDALAEGGPLATRATPGTTGTAETPDTAATAEEGTTT
jgi:AcrR family transcriptional regulator